MGRMFTAAKKKLIGDHGISKPKAIEGSNIAKFDLQVESPPLIFHGSPSQSTGALFSGQLRLTVHEPGVRLVKFEAQLLVNTHTKKPVANHCRACSKQTSQVAQWTFLTEPKSFGHGVHSFPFSHLLTGHLPATTSHAMGSIDYCISATAKTDFGVIIPFSTPVQVARAITSDRDRHSVRVFPPTTLTAHVSWPNAVHLNGEVPIDLSIDSLVSRPKGIRWNLKRLTWRIDEHLRIISPACKQHCAKIGGEGKGVMHEDILTIGGQEVKNGWKTDFDFGKDGRTELQFKANFIQNAKACCDMESASGMKVWHKLVLEMIVAEEQLPTKTNKHTVPTGSARVLRMEFDLSVTDRSGMGVSWDEEMPPMYDDVPPRPPTYPKPLPSYSDLPPLDRTHSDDSVREIPVAEDHTGTLEHLMSTSSLTTLARRTREMEVDITSFSSLDVAVHRPPRFSTLYPGDDIEDENTDQREFGSDSNNDEEEDEGLVMITPKQMDHTQ